MENKKYFLLVNNEKVEVDQQVYKVYYKEVEKSKYQRKKDKANKLVSYTNLDTDGLLAEELLKDDTIESSDDMLVRNETNEKLYSALAKLTEDERKLIIALIVHGCSERRYQEISGIKQTTISYRKKKILAKLASMMKS